MIHKPDKVWDINSKEYRLTSEPAVEINEHYAVFTASVSSREYYVKLFDYLSVFELDSFYKRMDRCFNFCKDYTVPYIPLKRPFMGYLIPKEGMRNFSDLKNGAVKKQLTGLYKLALLLYRLDERGFVVCGIDENAFTVFGGKQVLICSPECVYRKGELCMSAGHVMRRAPEAVCENGHIADWQESSYAFAVMVCSFLAKVPSYYDIENAGEALEILKTRKRSETSKDDEFEFEDDDTEFKNTEESSEKSDDELLEELIFGNEIASIFDGNASDTAREKGEIIELVSARLKRLIISAISADAVHSIRPDFGEWGDAIKECFLNLAECRGCGLSFFYDQGNVCPRCGAVISGVLGLTVQEYFDVSEFNKTIWYPYEKRKRLVKLSEPRYTRLIERDGNDVSVSGKDIGFNGTASDMLCLNCSDKELRVTMLMGERANVKDFTGKTNTLQKGEGYILPIPNSVSDPVQVAFQIGEQQFLFTLKVI